MAELNKSEVIGLLHFHKGIWLSHVAEFPFQKLMQVCKVIRDKDWYIDTKSDNKQSILLFFHKNSVLFHPWL